MSGIYHIIVFMLTPAVVQGFLTSVSLAQLKDFRGLLD